MDRARGKSLRSNLTEVYYRVVNNDQGMVSSGTEQTNEKLKLIQIYCQEFMLAYGALEAFLLQNPPNEIQLKHINGDMWDKYQVIENIMITLAAKIGPVDTIIETSSIPKKLKKTCSD